MPLKLVKPAKARCEHGIDMGSCGICWPDYAITVRDNRIKELEGALELLARHANALQEASSRLLRSYQALKARTSKGKKR